MVKRYEPQGVENCQFGSAYMEESEEGEWVKYTALTDTLDKKRLLKMSVSHANLHADAAIEDMRKYKDRAEEAEAENERLREALTHIANKPSEMIWGEDYEVKTAMDFMEKVADTALKGGDQ